MVIKYQIKFVSLPHDGNGELLTVNIYDATATTGTPVQLTGSASPFSTSGSDDSDFYTPVRSQSGYIRFICKDESVISDIMPEKATDRPVTLTDASGAVRWAGFLSGEQYSQPWEPTPYSLQLPVKGLLSTMAGVEFTQADGFTSVVSLVSTIAQYLPYTPRIIYPKSMAIDKVLVSNDNFREFLTKEERKDQNTENIYSADSIETVFEEFAKYFGVSAHEYHGDIYLIAHDATEYLCSDGSTVVPVTHDLLGLGIVGASNKKSFAKFYRYVRGEFDTGSEDDKAKTVTELNDFTEYMSGSTPTVGSGQFERPTEFLVFDAADPVTCLVPNTGDFYIGTISDNDYIFPKMLCGLLYRNGNAYYSNGGRVVDAYYNESGAHPIAGSKSNGGTDMFQIATPVATNEIKKVFTIKSLQNVKITKSERSLVNIRMNLRALAEKYSKMPTGFHAGDHTVYAEEGKIDNGGVYVSIKVGDLYLTEGSSAQYSWSITEGYIMCPVSDGVPAFNYLRDDDDARASVFVEDPGILISLPDSLRDKSVPVEIGLWSGIWHAQKWSSSASDFGSVTRPGVLTGDDGNDFDATFIHLIVTNFKISIAYEGGTQTIGTDLDQNVYIVPNDNASTYKYDVSSTITTRRGVQHGTGLALNDDLSYCTTAYDLDGCKRRAAMVAKNREMLTVAVENNTAVAPFDTIAWHGKTYSPLADNIDWSDNENELKLINID